MSLPLESHPAVDRDISDAFDWYERQSTGLGGDFDRELDRVFDEIEANPARFGFAEQNVREGAMRRFTSYAIYYRVQRNRIQVIAVWHTSRDPAGWRARL